VDGGAGVAADVPVEAGGRAETKVNASKKEATLPNQALVRMISDDNYPQFPQSNSRLAFGLTAIAV
jgi:hypothetical protein